MSDGIAPAIDKVGAPDPKAPEAEAAAPTMDTTTAPSEPAKSEDSKPAGLNVPAPKPVEVMSVPETPINNRTPAGGTPRPELNIEEESKEPPKNEDEVAFITTGVETGSAPAVSAPKDAPMTDKPADDKPTEAATNGASKPGSDDVTEAAAGEKRKLSEAAPTTNGASPADAEKAEPEERAKKARVDDVADEPTATETATNGKGTKAKKDKKAPPAVGRTARKTRSQGPVEAE
ncbi:hypothetical protein N0V84_008979 [Fusarium piperis]|uniref:Uncharacterized protein n=1 Tax=Fusarium piperis TaxID=1435070 RepID=A0A9W9BIZ0_9HYPO|nr:hypothetical protein N0V84_008979 [Fusarium piperis]